MKPFAVCKLEQELRKRSKLQRQRIMLYSDSRLADDEIQLDLLAKKKQDKTLEEILQFVERKESGKCSAGQLVQTHSIHATRSQYRRAKYADLQQTATKTKLEDPNENNDHCSYSGKQGHGKNAPTKITGKPPAPHTVKHAPNAADQTTSKMYVEAKTSQKHDREMAHPLQRVLFSMHYVIHPAMNVSSTIRPARCPSTITYATTSTTAGTDNHHNLNHS